MIKAINRIRLAAEAIFYHDLAYGEALMAEGDPLKVGDPMALEHEGLYKTGEDLLEIAQELAGDWEAVKGALWDGPEFETEIRAQLWDEVVADKSVRIIKLPSILAESDFDQMMEDFRAKHMLTEIKAAWTGS